MAIKIPLYEESVRQQAPRTGVPSLTPPTSLGVEPASSEQQLGTELQRFGGTLAKIIIDRRNMDEEREVVAADTRFQIALQESLYSQQQGDDQMPVGLMNRQLGNAQNSTVEFDSRYVDLHQKFMDEMDNDRMKTALSGRMDSQYAATRGQVIRHETVQGRENYKVTLEANLQQRVALSAGYTDPNSLVVAMEAGAAHLGASADKVLGESPESVKQKQDLFRVSMAKTNIDATVTKKPFIAQNMLDAVKESLPEKAVISLQETIDEKKIIEEADQEWNYMSAAGSDYLDDKGQVKREMALAHIDALDKTLEQKDEMKSIINRRLSEQDSVARERERVTKRAYETYAHQLQVRAADNKLEETEIQNLWVTKKIRKPLRDSLLKAAAVTYDMNKYNAAEKSEKRIELLDDLNNINGATVDTETNQITSPAEGESRKKLLDFRAKVLEFKPYITKEFANTLMQATQRNFNESDSEKVNLFQQTWRTLNSIGLTDSDLVRLGSQAAQIMWAASNEDAVKIAEETKAKAMVIVPGSQRGQTDVGKVFKGYKVTNFNEQGRAMTTIEVQE